mmetsp:Transcript_41294/g.68697  ORF Transcript_41294/g.68697 Transcript_41294/m.68697 type:complete len:254 (+) Transcript_41294:256-1017(+)
MSDAMEESRRMLAFRELLETERVYVRRLRECMKLCVTPLRTVASSDSCICSHTDLDIIFSNIPLISMAHEKLLHRFEKAFDYSGRRAADRIACRDEMLALCMARHSRLGAGSVVNKLPGDILQKIFAMRCHATISACVPLLISAFRCFVTKAVGTYGRYARQHTAAMERLQQLEHTEAGRFFRRTQLDGLQLQTVLAMPLSRLPRYALILADALKKTDADHPDYVPTRQLSLQMSESLARVNLIAHPEWLDPE